MVRIFEGGKWLERCKCGNLVPVGKLKDGLCVACVREAAEKRTAVREEQHLDELYEKYRSSSF